jgi:hypothetical protein
MTRHGSTSTADRLWALVEDATARRGRRDPRGGLRPTVAPISGAVQPPAGAQPAIARVAETDGLGAGGGRQDPPAAPTVAGDHDHPSDPGGLGAEAGDVTAAGHGEPNIGGDEMHRADQRARLRQHRPPAHGSSPGGAEIPLAASWRSRSWPSSPAAPRQAPTSQEPGKPAPGRRLACWRRPPAGTAAGIL